MNVLGLFSMGRRGVQLTALVEQTAARCHDDVWSRVSAQLFGMSTNEARGYVRARAAAVVHREVAIAADRHQLRADLASRLLDLTRDAVVRHAVARIRTVHHAKPRRLAA